MGGRGAASLTAPPPAPASPLPPAPARRRASWLEPLALAALRRPRLAIAAWAALALASALAALDLRIETSTDSVLDREGPSWQAYRESVERFGGDEVVVVAVRGETAWDPRALSEVARLSEELEAAPGIRRVDSLATVPVIRGRPDGTLDLDPALPDGAPVDAAGAARARAAVEGDRLAPGLLVSRDARAFSVTCIVEDITSEDDAAVLAAIAAAAPRLPTWRSGGPVFRTRVSEWTRDELARLVPATAATIALLVAIVFGASWHVGVPLLTGGLGSVVVLAAMARAGVAMTLTGAILPSVLLALGCAYALHVMAAFLACDDDVDARAEALRGLVRPIGLSGATTAIGFVAMSFVHIDVVRHVGVFGAVGTLVVMLASITFAPACLRGLHGRAPTRVWSWLASRAPERVFRLVAARPRATIAAWLAVAAAVGVGIARLEVETDVVLWFQRGSAVREDYEAIRAALAGISPMNVVVESRAGRAVTEPDVVRALAGLTEFLEAQPEMGRAISLADPLRQLHGGFLGDASQPLPTTRPQAEQYLLLLESVDSIRDLVASDRASANVLLRVDENGSNALVSLARRAEAWWRDHGPADFAASTTGVMHEYAVSENEIARGQLVGLAFALGSIGGLLVLVTRSARLAALALVPNVVPIVLLFGAMGLAGVPLDAGTVLIGCLALGIAVDDTIHLLERFRAGVARGAREALRAALAQTLPAIALTSIAVGAGFAALAISPFVLVRNLGVLTSAVMVACLLADLLLLPPLLLLAFGRGGASTGAREAADGPGAASSS